MHHHEKVLRSILAMLVSRGEGAMGTAFPSQPAQPLKLLDRESDPYSRKVREVLTLLNLDAEIYPLPLGGSGFAHMAISLPDVADVPQLIDENTGEHVVGFQTIIDHLFKYYGKGGKTPKKWQDAEPSTLVSSVMHVLEDNRGILKQEGTFRNRPEKLLELWSFEASPYTRLVRERLTELEIPYVLHNIAKERWQDIGTPGFKLKPGRYVPVAGGKREKLLQHDMQGRKIQVPYLVDPNTGIKMFESKQILKYLDRQYGV